MPSTRRQFIQALSVAAVALGGCATDLDGDSAGTPTERSFSNSIGEPATPEGAPVASSRWIEELSADVNTYSSADPPVAELDEILALFDAVAQHEWEPAGDDHRENLEVRFGEPEGAEITNATHETIQNHYDRERWRV